MKKTDELEIENELEALIDEANIMQKKEIQMKKFFNWMTPENEFTNEHSSIITSSEDIKVVDHMIAALETEKDKFPELLEFYKAFEDLRDLVMDSVSSEKKLAKACKEIFTGEFKKKDL
jgi:hypothetical protein